MKQILSRLAWLIVVLAIAGGGWWYFKIRPTNSAAPLSYRTNAVSRGTITQMVTANGSLNAVQMVTVGSQISGILTAVNVDFNSRVKVGDVMAKVDPATYERALAQEEAQLSSVKAGLELAQFNFDRAKSLFGSKLISESDFQQAEVSLHQSQAQVKVQEAQRERAKVDLDRTTIYAPISGIVISRSVDAGQTVAASFNTPTLFQIANDLAKMQIEALVSEADVGGIEEKQAVKFTVDAFPNRQFNGTVRQVRFAPVTNQNVVSYTTVVDVDNADLKLRPGMTANASIITANRTNVLKLPNASLRFRPPSNAVIGSTNNTVAKAAGTNAPAGRGRPEGLPTPPWVAEGRRPTDDERKKFDESLTPEQREQMREFRQRMQAMREAGGGGPGAGGPGGGGPGMGMFGGGPQRPSEGPQVRTIYRLDVAKSLPGKPVLEAVSIRTGVSDGSNTEVLEGLSESDIVITGTEITEAAAVTAPAGGGPFGGFGGMRPPR